jgi:ATP-dependent Clp protease ATP-binding subunit ClpA
MTSNLGSDEFKKFTQPLGFLENSESDLESVKKGVIKEAERVFSPEFLNRVDDIIVFSPLSKEEVKEIARMHLKRLRTRMKAEGKELEVNEDALNFLVEQGYSMKYGARNLKRVIDDLVKIPITLNWNDGNYFRVSIEEGHIAIGREWRDLSGIEDIDGFETVLT